MSYVKEKSNENIPLACASVLYQVMGADAKYTEKEKNAFSKSLRNMFALEDEELQDIFRYVLEQNEKDFEKQLQVLQEYIYKNPSFQLLFMQEANKLILSDGIDDKEYDFFEKLKNIFSAKK